MVKPKIIVAGAGCAGLWLAITLLKEGWTANNLVVIDKEIKSGDDRTWSYWAKQPLIPSRFNHHQFSKLKVSTTNQSKLYSLNEYSFYSIRSSTFYAYAHEILAREGVQIQQGAVVQMLENKDEVSVVTSSGKQYEAAYVLDSLPIPVTRYQNSDCNWTVQHFKGRFIKTNTPCFNPEVATFMDFSLDHSDFGFFYVLPTSKSEALVELAVYSKEVWSDEEYDLYLDHYQERLNLSNVEVVEVEKGSIPMTDLKLDQNSTSRIWKVGTVGGWVQPSSGFAFERCKRYAVQLVNQLKLADPKPFKVSRLQLFFNSVLLHYVIKNPSKAPQLFYKLFEKNGTDKTFDFLSEKAGLLDTLRVMWNSPRTAFTKIALQELFKKK